MLSNELLPDPAMQWIIAEAAARLRQKATAPPIEDPRPVIKQKRCSNCHETKPATAFYRDRRIKRDGRKGICIDCWAAKYGKRP